MQLINNCFVLLLVFCSMSVFAEPNEEAQNLLSLKKAIKLGLEYNPSARALEIERETASAIKMQQSSSPAPGISIGVDEVAGSGQFAGTRSMKSFVGLSQRFMTAGKLSIQKKIAEADEKAAISEISENRMSFLQQTGEQFFKIVFLEKQLELASQTLQLAQQSFEAVEKRLIAGDIPAIDLTRSKVNQSIAETSFRKARRELETAQKSMAASWNHSSFDYSATYIESADFFNFKFEDDSIDSASVNHPAALKASAAFNRADLERKLALAARTPDLIFKAGVSRFKESGNHASSFEVELDIQSTREIRGKKLAASAGLEKAKLYKQSIETQIKVQLLTLKQEIILIREEIASFRSNIMPAAEQAMHDSSVAYREGEQSLMDIFDTRKTMIEAAETEALLYHELFNRVFLYAILTGRENELFNEKGK